MPALSGRIAAFALAFLCALAQADVVKIPVGSQPHAGGAPLPPEGMSMQSVRAGWGEPAVAHDPVGKPPITRWDYTEFSVYFEYDHVVHAVVPHRAADPENRDDQTGTP